jgi:hypothetical protein
MKFITQLLDVHFKRYPRMEVTDVYKLLHQAAMGPEHAVQDAVSARTRLESEAAQLGEGPSEPLADVISPDGSLARVHLRPYLAAGHALEALAEAFVRTARERTASPDKLAKFCACLGDLAAAGGMPQPKEAVEDYFTSIAERGYPVVHHSQAYRDAYRPAYRVVALECLPEIKVSR